MESPEASGAPIWTDSNPRVQTDHDNQRRHNALGTNSANNFKIAYTVSPQVSTPAGGSWLKVSTSSGQTVGAVQVSVDLTGLSQGVYNGSVLFTPTDSTVNAVAVPVALIVGCGQGGCILQPNIIAVVNGASFHPTGAPGAAMTIFGTNLSDSTYQSLTYPLPLRLGTTSVMVNGVSAPLYYASPTQINLQMPTSAPASTVTVSVNNATVGFKILVYVRVRL